MTTVRLRSMTTALAAAVMANPDSAIYRPVRRGLLTVRDCPRIDRRAQSRLIARQAAAEMAARRRAGMEDMRG
jgi:hypothetical protein